MVIPDWGNTAPGPPKSSSWLRNPAERTKRASGCKRQEDKDVDKWMLEGRCEKHEQGVMVMLKVEVVLSVASLT